MHPISQPLSIPTHSPRIPLIIDDLPPTLPRQLHPHLIPPTNPRARPTIPIMQLRVKRRDGEEDEGGELASLEGEGGGEIAG